MKYLFINSVAGFGSTGRIAADQCRKLMGEGHECLLAYGREKKNCDDVPTIRIGTPMDYRIHGVRSRLLDDHGFGSYHATKVFLKAVRDYDPDVIWLHNIHGYYIHVGLLFDYLRTCGKKIYWTLHDCWAFTGHCVHFDYVQCNRWKTGCYDCPQKRLYPASFLRDNSANNYRQKAASFSGIPNLTVLTPSCWLRDRVRASFLGNYPVEVSYNTVDKTVFRPTRSDFRERYGLDDKYVILGVASVWTDRKGLQDFAHLATMLDESSKIVLIGLSQKQISNIPESILGLPRTDSVAELVEAYSAADVYVTPSVEETFGMTVLEAKCCGTEVIVYEGTACEEVTKQIGGVAVRRGAENIYRAICSIKEKTT